MFINQILVVAFQSTTKDNPRLIIKLSVLSKKS